MAKKTSVGLIVLIDIPSFGRVAILQRRGEFNHEKMGPESYPGAYQVTAHGGTEGEEDLITALQRELQEELGIKSFVFSNATEVVRSENDDKLVVTFAVLLSQEFLQEVRLGPSSGGLRLLREDEINDIQDLQNFDKKEGIIDRRVIAMFPDAKEAICQAFKIFAKK